MKEIDTGTLIQSADFWKSRWEETGSDQDLAFYREAESALHGDEPVWRSEWNQLKTFRDAVSQGLLANGMSLELVCTFTDLFLENAGRRWEEDQDSAREYMRHIVQVVTNGKARDTR